MREYWTQIPPLTACFSIGDYIAILMETVRLHRRRLYGLSDEKIEISNEKHCNESWMSPVLLQPIEPERK